MSIVSESAERCPVPPLSGRPDFGDWRQPDPTGFRWEHDRVVLTLGQFDGLHEYSSSVPSGVYPGKVWRARTPAGWELRWYADGPKPHTLTIRRRPLEVAP